MIVAGKGGQIYNCLDLKRIDLYLEKGFSVICDSLTSAERLGVSSSTRLSR